MDAIKRHAEMIIFLLAVIVCAALLWCFWPTVQKTQDVDVSAIKKALENREVTAAYPYTTVKANELQLNAGKFAQNINRPADTTVVVAMRGTIYPKPMRPKIEQIGEKVPKYMTAIFGELAEVSAHGDHGRIFLQANFPKMEYMDAIRVEIFRGDDPKKIDTKTPTYIDEILPEDKEMAAPTPVPAPTTAPDVKETKPAAAGNKDTKDAKDAKDKKAAEQDTKPALWVWTDTNVDEKKTYYYQVRLIGRMRYEPYVEAGVLKQDSRGNPLEVAVYLPPAEKTATNIKPTNSTLANSLRFYQSALTSSFAGTSLTDYNIRYAGPDESGGKVPGPEVPEWQLGDFSGYRGQFEVKVWLKEVQDYGKGTFWIGQNEPIKGDVHYKAPGAKLGKNYPFDSKYVMVMLRKVNKTREVTKTRILLDKDQNPVKDPITGELKKEQYTDTDKFVDDIAILKYLPTGMEEEFSMKATKTGTQELLDYLERIQKDKQDEKEKQKTNLTKLAPPPPNQPRMFRPGFPGGPGGPGGPGVPGVPPPRGGPGY